MLVYLLQPMLRLENKACSWLGLGRQLCPPQLSTWPNDHRSGTCKLSSSAAFTRQRDGQKAKHVCVCVGVFFKGPPPKEKSKMAFLRSFPLKTTNQKGGSLQKTDPTARTQADALLIRPRRRISRTFKPKHGFLRPSRDRGD